MKRIYIIAGEKSGDHYGAQLVSAFRQLNPQSEFYGYGGKEMEAAGVCLSRRVEDLEMIGLTEILQKLGSIRKSFTIAKKDILNFQPDALILIDYPGFNLRMAKWAKKRNFKVFYYIAPQTWAWKRGRNQILAQYVDEVFTILPFEAPFFKNDQVNASYVGHPMMDDISNFLKENQKPISKGEKHRLKVALLPGSRKSEIKRLRKSLLELTDAFPKHLFVLAAVKEIPEVEYSDFLDKENVEIRMDSSLNILYECDLGVVKSGTSTLQAALLDLPQMVIYKVSWLTGWLARLMMKVEYVALPNLIAGKKIVPEFLQNDCNSANLIRELSKLAEPATMEKIKGEYQMIRDSLSKENKTVDEVASAIYQQIKAEDAKN
jgi:lipid-A-disaccharide synthase